VQDAKAGTSVAPPVSIDIYFEIQTFLFHEANALDQWHYADWLTMLTDDVQYRVTARVIRDAGASRLEYALIDEDAAALKRRVGQISNPKLTYAENPPSFARRFISNVLASQADQPDHFLVSSHILVYRHRLETPEGGIYVGERHDTLRRVDGSLKIAARHVRLDQAAFSGSVSILF
jgi:3-phenylpropionate/cinnamic acid dioxygenase small subunit